MMFCLYNLGNKATLSVDVKNRELSQKKQKKQQNASKTFKIQQQQNPGHD